MAARKSERLLNLLITLLVSRSYVTKERIRSVVEQYREAGDEAFEKMFERDKEELRQLGVPLVTGTDSAWFEDELGYRIDREAYALAEIEFTPAELAVLGLASRVWQQASLAGPAARALVKLKALGVQPDADSLVGVEPRVRTSEPAFDPLYAAARDRTPVTFTYRKPGGEEGVRTVEPWVITSWHGRWYLVGHDRDRDAARAFRLSRISGRVRRAGKAGSFTVPENLDARAMVSGMAVDTPTRTARVRVRPGTCQTLRLRAGADADAEVLDVPYSETTEVAEAVAWHGPDAVALDPPEVVERVVALLRGTRQAHAPAVTA